MKIVSISNFLLSHYSIDPEVLQKPGRPCVLVVRLKYRGMNQDFAIPLRSNIPGDAPKDQYLPLPPRPTTAPGNRHGLHYIKMFPVSKKYLVKYRIAGNKFAILIQNIIDRNEKQIITICQRYLTLYESGVHPQFSTDLDLLLAELAKLK